MSSASILILLFLRVGGWVLKLKLMLTGVGAGAELGKMSTPWFFQVPVFELSRNSWFCTSKYKPAFVCSPFCRGNAFQQRPPEEALNSKPVRSQQSSCFAKNCPSLWLVWKGTHDKGILLWQWCLSMQKSVTLSIIPAITWFRLFAKIICLLSLFSSQDLWKLKQILSTLSLTVRTSLQIRRIAGMGDLLTEDFSLGKTTLKEVRSVDLFRILLGC